MQKGTYLPDCASCRRRIPMTTRQDMGCTFEERTAAPQVPYVLAWSRGGVMELPFLPSKCPLYLARLPALEEVERALPHWERGQLELYLGHATPAPGFLDAVRLLALSRDQLTDELRAQKRRGG